MRHFALTLVLGLFAVPWPMWGADERVYFSALDREERPVVGLTPADFELRVGGRTAAMEGFSAGGPGSSHSLVLIAWILLDASPNVSADVIRNQADSAEGIWQLFAPSSAVGVRLVSDRSEVLAPLSEGKGNLRRAFLDFASKRNALRARGGEGTVVVGKGGLGRAVELAVGELDRFVGENAALAGREVRKAVLILSDGDMSPYYKEKPLYELAARRAVFLYPVFLPKPVYGPWLSYYFDLAAKSGGVAAVFGALRPGSDLVRLERGNTGRNALNFNLILLARDIESKYSFTVRTDGAPGSIGLSVKCRRPGTQVRLARKSVP
jgi:hypothetical protein